MECGGPRAGPLGSIKEKAELLKVARQKASTLTDVLHALKVKVKQAHGHEAQVGEVKEQIKLEEKRATELEEARGRRSRR